MELQFLQLEKVLIFPLYCWLLWLFLLAYTWPSWWIFNTRMFILKIENFYSSPLYVSLSTSAYYQYYIPIFITVAHKTTWPCCRLFTTGLSFLLPKTFKTLVLKHNLSFFVKLFLLQKKKHTLRVKITHFLLHTLGVRFIKTAAVT